MTPEQIGLLQERGGIGTFQLMPGGRVLRIMTLHVPGGLHFE